MPEVRTSIEIAAPPEEVWDAVTDLAKLGEWVTIHKGFDGEPPPDVEKGTTFKQKLAVAGKQFKVKWQATQVSEPARIEWRGEGPLRTTARTRYELRRENGGTRFDYVNDFELPGGRLGEAAGGAVKSRSKSEARRSLDRLKALVES